METKQDAGLFYRELRDRAKLIEEMEQEGVEMLRSQLLLLPVEGTMTDSYRSDCKLQEDVTRAWQHMGVRFEPIPDEAVSDELFCQATIPSGWQIVASKTNPHYWSDLIDDRGSIRASMFYKAAYYDRRAHITVQRRFAIPPEEVVRCPWPEDIEPPYKGIKDSIATAHVYDHKLQAVIFGTPPVRHSKLVRDALQSAQGKGSSLHLCMRLPELRIRNAASAAGELAKAWLDERYPKWRDKDAYWGDDDDSK